MVKIVYHRTATWFSARSRGAVGQGLNLCEVTIAWVCAPSTSCHWSFIISTLHRLLLGSLNKRSCVGWYLQRVWEVGQIRIKSGWKPGREETYLVWVIPRRIVLHASPFNILMDQSNIILPYTSRPSRKPHSFGLSHQRSVSIYCLAHACHMSGQAHINYYSNIWWRIQIVTLSPHSFWFLTLRSKMTSSAICLRKPSACVLSVFSETKFHTQK